MYKQRKLNKRSTYSYGSCECCEQACKWYLHINASKCIATEHGVHAEHHEEHEGKSISEDKLD